MSALEQYISGYFGVTRQDLATIAALFKEQTLKKGDFFVKAGQHCDKLSFVQHGLLRIYVEAGDKDITQWITTPNYFVTDLASLVFGAPARRHIHALTNCTLYTIAATDYHRIHTLVPQWHELEKLFIARCFITLEDRIFSQLSLSAEDRYKQLMAHTPELFNQVPLQYLASMLGMTPETLSRIRAKKLS